MEPQLMTRRIAILLPSLRGGGAERVGVNIAAELARRGRKIDLLVGHAEGPYLKEVPAEVRIYDFKARRMATTVCGIAKYISREHPAALLSAADTANFPAILARMWSGASVRLVVTTHAVLSKTMPTGLKTQALLRLARNLYPKADHVVAVSNGAADDLAGLIGYPRQRISVIYNPVLSPQLFDKAREDVRHPFFAPDQPPVIVSAGRLTAVKDYQTLLTAFALLRAHQPSRLVILGEGDERPVLESAVARLGLAADVSFPGFTSNPYPYLARASLFALSSISEALPTVLIEALALGTPVVATRTYGATEILRHGALGTLCAVGDPHGIAEALKAVLAGPRKALPADAVTQFDVRAAVDQYEQLLLGGDRESGK
jgi:glycosyltransferase involved in cell wall biosynthesis